MKTNLQNLDKMYIKEAQGLSSFSFKPSDLQSLKYKNEIQFIIGSTWFPKFNLGKTISGTKVTKESVNSLVTNLKSISSKNFRYLFDYKLSGLGSGEVMMYFLLDEAYLGGGSSAGVDVIIGNNQYEAKSVDITTDGFAKGFFTGRKLNVKSVVEQVLKAAETANIKDNYSSQELKGSIINTLRDSNNSIFLKAERDYKELVYRDYFSKHKTILFDKKTGNIASFSLISPSDIFMETITQSQIKPKIKIK